MFIWYRNSVDLSYKIVAVQEHNTAPERNKVLRITKVRPIESCSKAYRSKIDSLQIENRKSKVYRSKVVAARSERGLNVKVAISVLL